MTLRVISITRNSTIKPVTNSSGKTLLFDKLNIGITLKILPHLILVKLPILDIKILLLVGCISFNIILLSINKT